MARKTYFNKCQFWIRIVLSPFGLFLLEISWIGDKSYKFFDYINKKLPEYK